MIILDTNVVSELMRPEPAPQVASWVRDRDRRELRTTTITLAKVRYGIARLPDVDAAKQVLLAAADDIFTAFEDQCSAGRHRSRRKLRRHRQQPRASRENSITSFDALIAAVCRCQGAALATRNVSDFGGTGIEIIDPWGANRDSI